jgi:hypothetical protein
MAGLQNMGRLLIIAGALIVAAGIILVLAGRMNVSWLGRLPGDILVKRKHFTFYFPMTTGILISVLFSLLLYLASLFFRK